MNKYLLTPFLLLISFSSIAQIRTIQLTKGKSFNTTTTTKGKIQQEVMGQPMDTDFDLSSKKKISVTQLTDSGYILELTTEKLKVKMSMPGAGTTEYDSENPNDQKGNLASLGDDINKPEKVLLSKDGRSTLLDSNETKKKNVSSDMMLGILEQFTGGTSKDGTIESNFMLLPQAYSAGSNWTDSSTDTSALVRFNYSWDSTINNTAYLTIVGKTKNTSKADLMGMEAAVDITTTITEIRKVDIATGIILNKNVASNLSGNIDLMGMAISINGTIESLSEISL